MFPPSEGQLSYPHSRDGENFKKTCVCFSPLLSCLLLIPKVSIAASIELLKVNFDSLMRPMFLAVPFDGSLAPLTTL